MRCYSTCELVDIDLILLGIWVEKWQCCELWRVLMHFDWITSLVTMWHAIASTLQVWLCNVPWLSSWLVFECLLGLHFWWKETIVVILCLFAHIGWNSKDSWRIGMSLLGTSPGVLRLRVNIYLLSWAVGRAYRWLRHSHICWAWQLFRSLSQVLWASNYGLSVPGKGSFNWFF